MFLERTDSSPIHLVAPLESEGSSPFPLQTLCRKVSGPLETEDLSDTKIGTKDYRSV